MGKSGVLSHRSPRRAGRLLPASTMLGTCAWAVPMIMAQPNMAWRPFHLSALAEGPQPLALKLGYSSCQRHWRRHVRAAAGLIRRRKRWHGRTTSAQLSLLLCHYLEVSHCRVEHGGLFLAATLERRRRELKRRVTAPESQRGKVNPGRGEASKRDKALALRALRR